jgi:hypothetical protein
MKCSAQAWVRGLERRVSFPDSGSMPDKLGLLCRLHRAHAQARLSSVGIPPCCAATMWSNWEGSSAIASGRWQYSQWNPARRRSVSFSDAAIQPINSIVHAGLRARLALLFKLMRAVSMASYSSNSRSSAAVSSPARAFAESSSTRWTVGGPEFPAKHGASFIRRHRMLVRRAHDAIPNACGKRTTCYFAHGQFYSRVWRRSQPALAQRTCAADHPSKKPGHGSD